MEEEQYVSLLPTSRPPQPAPHPTIAKSPPPYASSSSLYPSPSSHPPCAEFAFFLKYTGAVIFYMLFRMRRPASAGWRRRGGPMRRAGARWRPAASSLCASCSARGSSRWGPGDYGGGFRWVRARGMGTGGELGKRRGGARRDVRGGDTSPRHSSSPARLALRSPAIPDSHHTFSRSIAGLGQALIQPNFATALPSATAHLCMAARPNATPARRSTSWTGWVLGWWTKPSNNGPANPYTWHHHPPPLCKLLP